MVNASEATAPHRIDVPVSDDGGETLRRAIDEAVAWTAAGADRQAVVRLAAGVHLVRPVDDGPAAITIRDAERIDLVGADAELRFTDPHRGALDVARSTALRFSGFTIDYDLPSFSQGIVTVVDAARSTFGFRPLDGYPGFDDRELFTGSGYGTLRDASDGSLKPDARQTFMISYASEAAPDGSFEVTVEPSDRTWFSDIRPGDGFVVGHRGDRHGIQLVNCEAIVLDGLTIHSAPCAAILSNDSSDTVLDGVVVARRPGSRNWISSNADAFHCQGGRRGPRVVRCRFEGMHDDGINLYVRGFGVASLHGDGELALVGAGSLDVGDVLQFVDGATGRVLGEPATQVVESMTDGSRLVRVDGLPPGVVAGTAVYNRSNANTGFRISDSRFHDFRGIGVRLKASRGSIENCSFERLSGCGLWIANDPGWDEGPLGSRDVDLVANRFEGTPADRSLQDWPHSAATIMIELFDDENGPAAAPSHRDIRLVDTTVDRRTAAAVFVGAATDVAISALTVAGEARPGALATREATVTVDGVAVPVAD